VARAEADFSGLATPGNDPQNFREKRFAFGQAVFLV
jgi:hypothetical protein